MSRSDPRLISCPRNIRRVICVPVLIVDKTAPNRRCYHIRELISKRGRPLERRAGLQGKGRIVASGRERRYSLVGSEIGVCAAHLCDMFNYLTSLKNTSYVN
jgi:hypothetical protein